MAVTTPGVIRGCWRKIAYASEAEALVAVSEHRHPVYPYECPNCGRYHLTRKPQDGR